ncbi:WD40-repeat-containing domain protein [Infundibulicybe gibba]|nr:WD40-repeat-containing domain protein [Infundibulicybe gibba]
MDGKIILGSPHGPSFFVSSKQRKRKRIDSNADGGAPKKIARKGPPAREGRKTGAGKNINGAKKLKGKAVDEELESDGDGDGGVDVDDMDLRADEDEDETPAEKRLRLAKLYLESVKDGLADGEFDAAEIDKELISARLRQDVMEHSGKIHLFIADNFDFTHPPTTILRTRGHRFSVTCAVASESGKHLFTAGKEGKKITTFHKVKPPKPQSKNKGKSKATADPAIEGHTDEVWALALSGDGKYLASAGRDRRLGVWDAEKGVWVKGFAGYMGHKDSISALSFRKGTNQLYTASFDRTLKVYDLSPAVMGYVETLFGHQDHVLALDSLRGESCLSVGARDKTARFWKIVEETQLVFRGGGRSRVREVLDGDLGGDEEDAPRDEDGVPGRSQGKRKRASESFIEGSIECVAMIDETTFVTGGDSGSLCLWMTTKKKPVFTQALSHGFNEVHSETEGLIRTPRWITAVASLRYSDVLASGSWEGDIRIWKLDSKLKSFALAGTIPAPGVINSLQFLSPPKEFFHTAAWATPPLKPEAPDTAPLKREGSAGSVLLVAGVGQEHRLGRWLSVKEGVVNGAIVVAITPRTFT